LSPNLGSKETSLPDRLYTSNKIVIRQESLCASRPIDGRDPTVRTSLEKTQPQENPIEVGDDDGDSRGRGALSPEFDD